MLTGRLHKFGSYLEPIKIDHLLASACVPSPSAVDRRNSLLGRAVLDNPPIATLIDPRFVGSRNIPRSGDQDQSDCNEIPVARTTSRQAQRADRQHHLVPQSAPDPGGSTTSLSKARSRTSFWRSSISRSRSRSRAPSPTIRKRRTTFPESRCRSNWRKALPMKASSTALPNISHASSGMAKSKRRGFWHRG